MQTERRRGRSRARAASPALITLAWTVACGPAEPGAQASQGRMAAGAAGQPALVSAAPPASPNLQATPAVSAVPPPAAKPVAPVSGEPQLPAAPPPAAPVLQPMAAGAASMTPGPSSAPPPAEAAKPSVEANGGLARGPDPSADSAAHKGPYQVGQIKDGFRNGPDFGGATISYPMDADPPFAMIVFCPGFLGTQASDAPWAPFMASHGIVFMNIDTNTTSDSVALREKAELDAWESLKLENTRDGSPLKGKLDLTRVGLMGWSMGGGGAWLNAKAHPELKSIVTLAGHNATAGGAQPDSGITVPTLMLAGTADTAILGLGMSQPVYEVIPDSTPKLLYEVEGASHFDFNDPAYLDGAPARYALSWEKVYLEGDLRYRKFLLEKGPKASDFRSNLE